MLAEQCIYSVRLFILFSFSFFHISGCELQLRDLNLSSNKNVENYKTNSGAGGWVQLTLTTQS